MLIFLGTEYTDQRWRQLISLCMVSEVGRRIAFAKCTAPARGATANELRWQRYLPRPTAAPPLSPSRCQLLTQTLTTTREARNVRQQRESTGRLRPVAVTQIYALVRSFEGAHRSDIGSGDYERFPGAET